MTTKPRKTKISGSLVVPIVADAGIAGPIAEGRLIPLLILDTQQRRDVAELIRVHEHIASSGDAQSQWSESRDDRDIVALHLTFTRPMNIELLLRFSIEHQAILVETVLVASAVFLQAGRPGDRFMNTVEAPRILVELPDTGFRDPWNDILLKRMTDVMAASTGLPRKNARPLAQKMIAEMKELAGFRMRAPESE